MLTQHLSAFQVVIPLLAAPLCAIFGRSKIAWFVAAIVGLLCIVNSLYLLEHVQSANVVIYSLGGWAAPFGIEYRIDAANAFILLIISIVYVIGVIYARTSIGREVSDRSQRWLYTAWILCFAGLCGITISGDVFNVFVFLEISSLSTYILISFGSDRRSLTAALRYLVMGTIAATFYLIGVGLLYALTGTLNMADLAQRMEALPFTGTALVAFGFITIGLSIKIAVFPFHNWLPNAYTYAPSAITAFLAGTATKAAVYVFIRLWFSVVPHDVDSVYMSMIESTEWILIALGVLGAIIASGVAFFQDDVKRLLAWSSIGQIGYMVLGVGIASVAGVAASFLHIFNHALMKTALFMAVGCLFFMTGATQVASLKNMGRKMPWTMAAIVICGLSLVGVPFTTGFISKWYLVSAAFEQNLWWIALLVLLGSLVSAAYVWKIVEVAYFRTGVDKQIQVKEAPLSILVPTWILVLANIYFGINAQFTGSQATRAAMAVLGM